MGELKRVSYVLLVLLCALVLVLLCKQLGLDPYIEQLYQLITTLLTAICFVLIFEPVIEKIPLKQRSLRCGVVYLFLFVIAFIMIILFLPIVSSQSEKLMDLFQMVIRMSENESEMALSYESALHSTLLVLKRFGSLAVSYLMAFFISLEYPDFRVMLIKTKPGVLFFELYDEFKEIVFQYMKALLMDLTVLFISELIVLRLFNVQYAFSLALILSLLNLIPYFGSVAAQVLIFLVDTLSYGSFRFDMILTVFIVQQIEANALQPVLYGKMMNLRPVTMFASILFFGSMLGLIGVLFAPIFAVAIQFLILKVKNFTQT